jgi:hypothetical protein
MRCRPLGQRGAVLTAAAARGTGPSAVMVALVATIHVLRRCWRAKTDLEGRRQPIPCEDVDGRDKPDHDGEALHGAHRLTPPLGSFPPAWVTSRDALVQRARFDALSVMVALVATIHVLRH